MRLYVQYRQTWFIDRSRNFRDWPISRFEQSADGFDFFRRELRRAAPFPAAGARRFQISDGSLPNQIAPEGQRRSQSRTTTGTGRWSAQSTERSRSKKAQALLRSGDYSKVQVAEELAVSCHTLWRALAQESVP